MCPRHLGISSFYSPTMGDFEVVIHDLVGQGEHWHHRVSFSLVELFGAGVAITGRTVRVLLPCRMRRSFCSTPDMNSSAGEVSRTPSRPLSCSAALLLSAEYHA